MNIYQNRFIVKSFKSVNINKPEKKRDLYNEKTKTNKGFYI